MCCYVVVLVCLSRRDAKSTMRNRCAEPGLAGLSRIRELAPVWEEFLPGKHARLAYEIS